MREFEVLEHLDVCAPDQEVSMLLSPALLKRPVLATLDTSTLHHPEIYNTKSNLLIPSSSHHVVSYSATYVAE